MGDFKYQDGLFHFVFANQDTYVLESMVRLDLMDKLYRELCGQKYRQIIFLKGGIHPCVLVTKDRASYEFCQTAARRRAFFGLARRPEIPEFRGQDVERTDEDLRAMLSEATETAFVARVELFDRLYREHPGELAKLLAENSHRHNALVLLSTVRAEDSLPYFRDPNGIFAAEGLFPEVQQAFSDEHCREGRGYELLQVYLGNRCLFYNSLSRYSVTNTVRRVLFQKFKGEEEKAEELVEPVAAFVYAWYHSPALRRRYPDCLSPNEDRRYAELARTLERRLTLVLGAMEACNLAEFPLDTENIDYIHEDTSLYLQLKNVKLSPEAKEVRRWEALVQAYGRPRGHSIPVGIFHVLRFAAESMERAANAKDAETFAYCAICLEYGLKSKFSGEGGENWELWKNCIEVSSRRFEMGQRIAEKRESIRVWRAEWDEMVAKIRRKERSRISEGELYYDKEAALDLNARIESYQKILHEDLRESAYFRKLLTQMEVMLSARKSYMGADAAKLEDILKVSQQAIERYAKEKDEERERIQQAKYDLDDLLEGRTEVSVKSRFDDMVGRVEEEEKNGAKELAEDPANEAAAFAEEMENDAVTDESSLDAWDSEIANEFFSKPEPVREAGKEELDDDLVDAVFPDDLTDMLY